MEDLADIFTHRFAEFLMVHCLEHIPRYEMDTFFSRLKRIVKKDATCVFAVPDNLGIARLYVDAANTAERARYHDWIFGSQRDQYSHHYVGYDKDSLTNLLEKHFEDIQFFPSPRGCLPSLF